MPSNINPSLEPTKSLSNFRFWCQKVLPLVYDDSLSYYEVLGKMVVQLNDVIDNVNADTENVLTLKDAFIELQTYVNNFFDDIDQLASYAERAEAAQTAANTSAVNAATSASNASESSLAAMNARDAANLAKQAAQTSANNASTAATNANTKANEAAQSAITAQTAQASASQSATLAATDRSAAQTAASTATTKANEANTSATNAETSAENAAQSESNVEELVNNIQENLDNIQQNTKDISDLKESIIYENVVDNENNYIVDLGRLNGKYASYNTANVSRFNNLFYADGPIASDLTRFSLTGVLDFRGASPTYAAKPDWYVDNLTDFIIGHKYQFVCNLLSGNFVISDQSNTYPAFFTIRTIDQSLNISPGNGSIWECSVVPNMVCLVLRAGTYSNCVLDVKIIDITKREISSVENAGLFNYSVPDYFNTQLNNAITKINTDINSNKTEGTYGTSIESFVFITDVHWLANKKHSPALIKKILESCPIKTVIGGGDLVYNSNTKSNAVAEIKAFTDAIMQIPCYDYFTVNGNHDANIVDSSIISDQFTKEEEYNLLYAPFTNKSNIHWIWEEYSNIYSDVKVKNDFYVDHARTRTRYLCLDWSHPIGIRKNWIETVLAKDDNFKVVIIYHGVYKNADGTLTPEHESIMSIIEPYKGKIVAMFCGHAHKDAVIDYYGDGSVPIIITSCDTYSEVAGAVANTIDEQCFDVAVIDYGQSKIELTRIGRGSDRTVNISVT